MKYMEYSKGDALTGLGKLSNGRRTCPAWNSIWKPVKMQYQTYIGTKALNSKKRETKAVQEILALVTKMGLENRMEYITSHCTP